MILKEEYNLTDSNLFLTRDLEGNITSVYFLVNSDKKNGIEDLKFNIRNKKITISGILRE